MVRLIMKRISFVVKSVEVMYLYMKVLLNWLVMRDEIVYFGVKRVVVRLNVFFIMREMVIVLFMVFLKVRIVFEIIVGFM